MNASAQNVAVDADPARSLARVEPKHSASVLVLIVGRAWVALALAIVPKLLRVRTQLLPQIAGLRPLRLVCTWATNMTV